MEKKEIRNENLLLDSWETSGNNLEELKKTVDALTKRTQFLRWKSGDIELLSFNDRRTLHTTLRKNGKDVIDKDGKPVEGDVPCVVSTLLSPDKLPSECQSLTLDSFLKSYREESVPTKELLNEWTDTTKLGIVFNDTEEGNLKKRFYLTSSNTLQTMDRFGLAGNFLSEPSLERDMLIAKQFEKDYGITVIARKVGETKKVFSILSDKYRHLDQDLIFKVIEDITNSGAVGTVKCHRWEVSNFYTKVWVEFPERAEEFSVLYGLKTEMIPGILITTSDTGDSSFSVCGTWRVSGHNSYILASEVKKKHIGNFTPETILEDVSQQVFAEYDKLPKALCDLITVDITDPTWDLSTTAGLKANRAEVEASIKTAFKSLGIVKAIGKKAEKTLREAMIEEFDYSVPFTAYDIAMSIFTLPERAVFVGKATRDLSNLQKCVYKAPFVDYKAQKEENDVILTA